MRPVICMVTNRVRGDQAETDLVHRVAAAARAGVHLIQVRDPGLEGGPLARLVTRCVEAVRSTPARIVVNERLDVALAACAHGVHLRADSMPGSRVRSTVPPGFLIGRSVHTADEVERADSGGALDYLIFGTVFPTATKPGTTVSGPGLLADAVRSTRLPILAIGGVSIETIGHVARSGAAGFAAISLFAHNSPDRLQVIVTQAALAFDTLAGRSLT